MRLSCVTLLAALATTPAFPAFAQTPMTTSTTGPIILHADRIIDGRGNVDDRARRRRRRRKITRVDKSATGAVTYDLKGMTLLPGLIDAHAHLTWYFNRKGRYHTNAATATRPSSRCSSTAGKRVRHAAWRAFTTIQSPGLARGRRSARVDRAGTDSRARAF